MKKLMMMLVTAMMMTAGVQAQDAESARAHKSPEEKAKMMTQKLDKELDLTDAQEAKVMQIYLNHARQKAELKQNAGADKDTKMQQMKSLRAETDRQLATVLTPAQAKKKAQLDAERKEKYGKHKGKDGHKKGHKGNK